MYSSGFLDKFIFVVIAAIYLSCVSGCNNEDMRFTINSNGGLINKPGIYTLPSQQYTINVQIDSNYILHYSVQAKNGIDIIKSVEQPSALQKWCLYWDHNDTLWVESSDIGGFVWKKELNGTYQQYPVIDDAELYKQMPEEIFDCLPTTIKKRWKTIRNSGH